VAAARDAEDSMRQGGGNGAWWTLGLVGAVAAAGALHRERGSRAEGQQKIRRGHLKADTGLMWKLMSGNIYGTSQKVPFIATREALQNSRDAIKDAIEAGQISPGQGRFDVRWDEAERTMAWEDNGIGMSSDTVFDVFLNLGKSKGKGAQKPQRAGGFGLAKAVLLGCSETFRWKLHTRGSVYVSEGFDEDVIERPAPSYKKGLTLTVYDVKGGGFDLSQKIKALLASSETDIRLTFNGETIAYAFHGKGERLFENANWGSGVTGKVTAYQRLDNDGGIYVRLKGLTQFVEKPRGLTSDFVVDLDTTLPPTKRGYPFVPSRMALDGQAWQALYQIREELLTEKLSASKRLAESHLDDEAASPEQAKKNQAMEAALMKSLLDDPAIAAMLDETQASGQMLRDALRQQRSQSRQQAVGQSSAATKAFSKFVEETSNAAVPATQQKMQQIKQQAARNPQRVQRKLGEANPLAGIGKVRINRTQWDEARLAPFLKRHEAMIPLLTLWRFAIASLLKRKGRGAHFSVGLIFDDAVLAAHEGTGVFYINPARVVKVIEKSPNRPDVVAALVFNSAAHEATHNLGYSNHDESFVAERQALADYNVDLLPLLSAVTSKLLGMQPAKLTPQKPKAPRAPKAQKIALVYGGLDENRGKLKKQIYDALEPRQKLDGFVLDEYEWTADERFHKLHVYDRPTRDPDSGDELGSVNIGWHELSFYPNDAEYADKRWSGDSNALTNEPSGTPVDLAKPSVAFLLAEFKKAKKALAKKK
jgi:hypothetical protein